MTSISRGLVAEVRDGHPAHFRVVFGRDQHLQGGRKRPVAARELGAVLVEGDLVAVGLGADRLVGRRPDLAAGDVPQEDVGAPVVAGGVLAPAGHRQVAPGAVAGSGGGEHHGIAAVGEQLGGRRGAPRTGLAPGAGSFDLADRSPPTSSPRPTAGPSMTSRGTRSCSSSSVAWTIGSAWKRLRITPSSRASAMAVIVMPWWWAMKARTTATRSPSGTRAGVKSSAS